jgi:hypothetical protein
VCGPPLGGKGPLAARVEELLPYCVKLESIDNLSHEDQSYTARVGRSAVFVDVESTILSDAFQVWRQPAAVSPVIVICARFQTQSLRRAAADFALSKGMRFLLVEAMSSPIRSLRRISRLMLSPKDTTQRIERYDRAQSIYKSTTPAERAKLPGLAFRTVLANLDDVAERVVSTWYCLQ